MHVTIIETMAEQQNVIKLDEQQRQSLENDVKSLTNVIQQQNKSLNDLKRERDRNVANTQSNFDKIGATQSQLAIKTKEIVELTWELNEIRSKLAYTQQHFESITAERNALQKEFDAITEDRNEVRDKLRVTKYLT